MVLLESPAITPYTGTARIRTMYALGTPEKPWAETARVLGVKPRGTDCVEISAVIENELVHTAEGTS